MKGKLFAEWLFCVLLSLLFFLGSIGIVFLSPIFMLVAPAPIAILCCRQGIRRGVIGVIAGIAFVITSMGGESAFFYLCNYALLGLILGALLVKIKKGTDYVLFAIIASLAMKLLLIGGSVAAYGANPFIVTPEAAQALASSLSGVLSQGGKQLSEEEIASYMENMAQTVSLMMPAMLILFSAADAMFCHALARVTLRKFENIKLPQLPPFAQWRFPKNVFWALLAALILDMASRAFPDEGLLEMLALNLMEVLRGLFLVEGISLLWYFGGAYGINIALRTVLALFCIFFAPVSHVLSMVGVLDMWYDLRKRIKLRRKQ